jgi:hypothetical protein
VGSDPQNSSIWSWTRTANGAPKRRRLLFAATGLSTPKYAAGLMLGMDTDLPRLTSALA